MTDDPFGMSPAYRAADAALDDLTDTELHRLTGAILGELVNRGATATAAAASMVDAITGGIEGSDRFDREYPS